MNALSTMVQNKAVDAVSTSPGHGSIPDVMHGMTQVPGGRKIHADLI